MPREETPPGSPVEETQRPVTSLHHAPSGADIAVMKEAERVGSCHERSGRDPKVLVTQLADDGDLPRPWEPDHRPRVEPRTADVERRIAEETRRVVRAYVREDRRAWRLRRCPGADTYRAEQARGREVAVVARRHKQAVRYGRDEL